MIEGMIGAVFVLSSFVGGYFFRKHEEKALVPKQDIEQERQLPPEIENQINNIWKAWE